MERTTPVWSSTERERPRQKERELRAKAKAKALQITDRWLRSSEPKDI